MPYNAIANLCNLSVEVKDFFSHLVDTTGITYASHLRLFNNGKAFELSNNPEFLQHFLEHKYAIPEPGVYTQPSVHVWGAIPALKNYDSRLIDMKLHFGIDHQIAIIYPNDDYIDRFALGTTSNRPEMINYIINNKESMDNLFLNYKDKFSKVIKQLDANPIDIPLRPKNFIQRKNLDKDFADITPREMECIALLAKGFSAKMIAIDLNISPRTVERHIDNIRSKLGVKNKMEILNKYFMFIANTKHI